MVLVQKNYLNQFMRKNFMVLIFMPFFANGIKDNSEIYGNQLKGKIKKNI